MLGLDLCDKCEAVLDVDGVCPVCHVHHGEACPDCGRRGYHMSWCKKTQVEQKYTETDKFTALATRLRAMNMTTPELTLVEFVAVKMVETLRSAINIEFSLFKSKLTKMIEKVR